MRTVRDTIMARYASAVGARPEHVELARALAKRHGLAYPAAAVARPVRAALRGDLEASLVRFRGVLNKITDENYERLEGDARAAFLPDHAAEFLAAIETALTRQKGKLVRPLSELAVALVGESGVRETWVGEALAADLAAFRRGEADIDATEQYDEWCEYLKERLALVNRAEAAVRVGSLPAARVAEICATRLADRSEPVHALMTFVAVAERMQTMGFLRRADGEALRRAVTQAPPAKPMIRFKVLDIVDCLR